MSSIKKLLLILILTLSVQTLVKADDIYDLEIEGMSVGDSLLDFFSKKKLKRKNFLKQNRVVINKLLDFTLEKKKVIMIGLLYHLKLQIKNIR